jgi:hypothetical protein
VKKQKSAELFPKTCVLFAETCIFASTNIEKMFVIILLTVVILIVCIVLMSIRVILKKDGRFPDMHVGNSKALREKGIYCAKAQDWEAGRRENLFERLDK